jgi:hypothetical protein
VSLRFPVVRDLNFDACLVATLMRSADPNREFGDMAGKALSIQWMVDNAPQVFAEAR